MRHILTALICLMLLAPPASAERPQAGFLWNRSGLPATLPLQVRSPAGRDYAILLTRPEGHSAEVAGYVRGGDFFRLLVPPGDWMIGIASGQDWQGPEALFGPETQWTHLPDTLHFIAGDTRLNGHVLTLDATPDGPIIAEIAPQAICRVPRGLAGPIDATPSQRAEAPSPNPPPNPPPPGLPRSVLVPGGPGQPPALHYGPPPSDLTRRVPLLRYQHSYTDIARRVPLLGFQPPFGDIVKRPPLRSPAEPYAAITRSPQALRFTEPTAIPVRRIPMRAVDPQTQPRLQSVLCE